MAKNGSASELSSMNKQQLLELLLEQSKEADALKRENIDMQKELHRVRKMAAEYRSDLDHAYSLLRLTMRLENIIQKLDPSYVPDHYEPGLLARLQAEDELRAAREENAGQEILPGADTDPEEEITDDAEDFAEEAADQEEELADAVEEAEEELNAEEIIDKIMAEADGKVSDAAEAAEEEVTRRGRFFGRRE